MGREGSQRGRIVAALAPRSVAPLWTLLVAVTLAGCDPKLPLIPLEWDESDSKLTLAVTPLEGTTTHLVYGP